MLTRTVKIARVEKKDDKYGIWPEMSVPFSLPCSVFKNGAPKIGDEITAEYKDDKIVGAVHNGTRLFEEPAE